MGLAGFNMDDSDDDELFRFASTKPCNQLQDPNSDEYYENLLNDTTAENDDERGRSIGWRKRNVSTAKAGLAEELIAGRIDKRMRRKNDELLEDESVSKTTEER